MLVLAGRQRSLFDCSSCPAVPDNCASGPGLVSALCLYVGAARKLPLRRGLQLFFTSTQLEMQSVVLAEQQGSLFKCSSCPAGPDHCTSGWADMRRNVVQWVCPRVSLVTRIIPDTCHKHPAGRSAGAVFRGCLVSIEGEVQLEAPAGACEPTDKWSSCPADADSCTSG